MGSSISAYLFLRKYTVDLIHGSRWRDTIICTRELEEHLNQERTLMKPSKSVLESLISRYTRLRLKENVYGYLKNREWLFNRMENDLVYLLDESGSFGMAVKIESIDWSRIRP